ncbi:trypsin-like peptidase domain-containing protein [Metallumcola ferriviriculae]|uniref:Probable periplasmic serine endoprotease DegP-like n=1 Tax=Metallumcola ferriviriculae TaxID=3039180 RepID=A0AAU0UJH0_9FIRM|nr:trypsin-like peptidase domain-containing protein [Desulfitibacteraceae bacterium MK1]
MGVIKNRTLAVVLSLVFVGGLLLGGTVILAADYNPLQALNSSKEAVPPAVEDGTTVLQHTEVQNDVAGIVNKAGKAVVKIETVMENSGSSQQNPFFQDPFFRQFFGDQFAYPQQPRTSKGLGSGFIISKDGYILTNEHVVSGANEINVEVAGYDEAFSAKLVGSDHNLDLAVLKINADKDLPVLALGSSQDARAGDWVIAIGNPYGLDHTVTVGVISAKGRPITIEDRHYKNLLQTDASINPGNSGGPLLNMNGEVVGINTAINAQAQGIGFAIPTSTVKEVFNDLKEKGHVVRPYLGVMLQPVTPELKEYFGLDNTQGALVAYVQPGSPADEAGLKRGDVILEFNKKEVVDPDKLVELVKESKIGDKAVLLINRQGSTRYVTVKIGEEGKN